MAITNSLLQERTDRNLTASVHNLCSKKAIENQDIQDFIDKIREEFSMEVSYFFRYRCREDAVMCSMLYFDELTLNTEFKGEVKDLYFSCKGKRESEVLDLIRAGIFRLVEKYRDAAWKLYTERYLYKLDYREHYLEDVRDGLPRNDAIGGWYDIEQKKWFDDETGKHLALYDRYTPGSVAGEGEA